MFRQDFSCPALLVDIPSTTVYISNTGLSPSTVHLSIWFFYINSYHISASPGSLATTAGISIDFFSSGYLDVSVHQVRFQQPILFSCG